VLAEKNILQGHDHVIRKT